MTRRLPEQLRRSSAHVFVSSLDEPDVDSTDIHHLRRALRLRDGAHLTVSDGAGTWSGASLLGDGIQLTGDRHHDVRAQHRHVTIATAIPKGDRLEWMVHKLTEIGVDRIVLVDCARSVVRWDAERAARHLERLSRIVREAAMQSRRTALPEVHGPVAFGELRAAGAAVVADPDGEPLRQTMGPHTVIVGPEGGLTAEEASGASLVSLSPQVLRIETAAVAAAVLLCQ